MPKIWWIGAAAAVVVAGAIGWWQLSGRAVAPQLGAAPTAASSGQSAQSALAPEADDHVLGKADAPITIVEYASLTCPHCGAFHRDVMPQVKKEWIETGKAKLVYRNFPLNQQALTAAKLAECMQGERYFGLLDVLFQQMDRWATQDPVPGLTRLGKLGGLGDEQIKSCLSDAAAEKRILQKQLIGQQQLGVGSTPTFFINGRKIVGAETYDMFRQALVAAGS
jgi:protein-disulfide isomerase